MSLKRSGQSNDEKNNNSTAFNLVVSIPSGLRNIIKQKQIGQTRRFKNLFANCEVTEQSFSLV
ncbi:hypothetical protein L3i20_v216750 [Paenibacillus sp. L3-i20]|nr:hypothetical protein L3i20_v216750 [Paenibacillus sp. L3-i20]